MSCEETAFSILSEQIVEERMTKGESYHDAYLAAVAEVAKVRDHSMQQAIRHSPVRVDLLNPDHLEGSGNEAGMPRIPETIDSVEILKRN